MAEAGRILPGGRLFIGPPGTPVSAMTEVAGFYPDGLPEAPLRAMSPWAVLGRKAKHPEHGDTIFEVWAVHRLEGMVWLAAGNHAVPARVIDLQIGVASPHLCKNDELCCDTCNVHLGCRCPLEPGEPPYPAIGPRQDTVT